MTHLTKAIISVMQEVNYLSKDDKVGYGQNSYKAITDEKVRKTLRESMAKYGLVIFQESIDFEETIHRWQEEYKGQIKQKQQVKITAKVTYKIVHVDSGESQKIQSLGIGIDPQDKSAGKATTYAMKYALLNLFLIPTGDDPDSIHSDDIEVPMQSNTKHNNKKDVSDDQIGLLITWIQEKPEIRYKQALHEYNFSASQLKTLKNTFGNGI